MKNLLVLTLLISPVEYAILCMEHCGKSLRELSKNGTLTVNKVASIIFQVLLGLAAAEALYEYEHRDLHMGNIMVRNTQKRTLTFVVNSKQYHVDTDGIRAFIIDNTFARMRIGTVHFYTYLSDKLASLVSNDADPTKTHLQSAQDKVYVVMAHLARDNWAQWIPRTNLIWMRFVLDKLLSHMVPPNDKVEEAIEWELMQLKHKLENLRDLQDVLRSIRQNEILQS